MHIAIKNNKNKSHTICRTTGRQIEIQPYDFIVLDTEDEQEIEYWTCIKDSVLERCGLSVFTDNYMIGKLVVEKMANENRNNNTPNKDDSFNKRDMEYTDVSILGDCASPIARQIAADTFNKQQNNNTNQSNNEYTEDSLSKMEREDLINICENFGIKYRKNNTSETLIKLILGSDKI